MTSDVLRVLHNFWGEGILMLWYVIELLKHRQVAVAFNVAHRSGITIPIPGSAEIPTAFDNANIGEAGLAEPSPHQQTAETTANNCDFNLVEERFPFHGLFVRVV